MKIISKYKDYYDYLVGTYGEDPKLILDRREGFILSKDSTECKYQLYICGKIIDIYYILLDFLGLLCWAIFLLNFI